MSRVGGYEPRHVEAGVWEEHQRPDLLSPSGRAMEALHVDDLIEFKPINDETVGYELHDHHVRNERGDDRGSAMAHWAMGELTEQTTDSCLHKSQKIQKRPRGSSLFVSGGPKQTR